MWNTSSYSMLLYTTHPSTIICKQNFTNQYIYSSLSHSLWGWRSIKRVYLLLSWFIYFELHENKTRRVLVLRNTSSKQEREITKEKNYFLRSKPQKNIVRVSLNIFPVVSSVEYTTSTEIRESNFSIQYQDATRQFFGVGDSVWKNLVWGNHKDSTVEEFGSSKLRKVYKGNYFFPYYL